MKYLAILVVCLAFSSCNAKKLKRCRPKNCIDVEVQRQQLINFPFGCLNTDYLSEWRKCVLQDDQSVKCLQERFNKCTRQIKIRHDKGCDKCDAVALKNNIDQLQKINFSCFYKKFLGYFNDHLSNADWDNDKCPGAKLNKFFKEAYAKDTS